MELHGNTEPFASYDCRMWAVITFLEGKKKKAYPAIPVSM